MGRGGYAIPTGGEEQLDPLAFSNLDQIVVRFSENVIIGVDDIRLVGVLGADGIDDENREYNVVAITTGIGSSGEFEAVIDLGAPIGTDKVMLTVFESVTNLSGRRLDGQWSDGASVYPSGNGAEGGDFSIRFNVLPGDINQDRNVGGSDLSSLLGAWLQDVQPTDVILDLDGDTKIGGSDLSVVIGNWLSSLPPGSPSDVVGGQLLAARVVYEGDPVRHGLLGVYGYDWVKQQRHDSEPRSPWQEERYPDVVTMTSSAIIVPDSYSMLSSSKILL